MWVLKWPLRNKLEKKERNRALHGISTVSAKGFIWLLLLLTIKADNSESKETGERQFYSILSKDQKYFGHSNVTI